MKKRNLKKRYKRPTENSGKTTKRGRPENLKPFLPGTSGNAGGRPKTAALSVACRDKLGDLVPGDPHGRTYAQCIADRLGELAIAGNLSAAQELADRAEGRPRQAIDANVNATMTPLEKDVSEMSDEELEARTLELLRKIEKERGRPLTLESGSEMTGGINGN